MSNVVTGKDLSTPAGRWSGLGPYYAMFPVEFAFQVVRDYSEPGDAVLDPFTGRGTSVFAAAAQGRTGVGSEINKVGWLYSNTKLGPAQMESVLGRLREVHRSTLYVDTEMDHLPEFFRYCYSPRVLQFLLRCRALLNWKYGRVDGSLMAILLVYLHGKQGSALSNQMRQGKAMAPDYSVRWWREHRRKPPDIDPLEFLSSRIEWRYKKGIIPHGASHARLGDSTRILPRMASSDRMKKRFDLLFTSPPYHSVTNYAYDQWLRLWMLGGPAKPNGGLGTWQRRFDSRLDYERLLRTVFAASKVLLRDDARIYVRTDAREFTYKTTLKVLNDVFQGKECTVVDRPLRGASQTALYRAAKEALGERDIILT